MLHDACLPHPLSNIKRIRFWRKNGSVEFLNPLNGNAIAATKIGESNSSSHAVEDDLIVGIHLLRAESIELSSKLIMPLICTEKGKACVQSIATTPYSTQTESRSTWDVCGSGKLTCSSVDASKSFALFGGKGVEVNLWDIHNCKKTWTAKSPHSNSLGIFSPTWFTSSTFLSQDDHRRIATGTSNHQVRLYDISAQRRPVISVSFRESPVKVVTADQDGNTIYIGTGTGDLASFDMRTGKLLGCFVGKCSGSIRSIVRHPELPLIASCGLDRYLRFWNTKTRQLLSAVFLKQHLTNVVIDSHFSTEEITDHYAEEASTLQVTDHSEVEDGEEFLSSERRASKRKSKTKKRNKKQDEDGDNSKVDFKRGKPSEVEEEEQGKRLKKKQKKK